MADLILTQAEADALIALEKVCLDDREWDYPAPGETLAIPLISTDKRENFILDLERGSINLTKGKYQNRARKVVVLIRLDFGGSPHRNPDDTEVPSPHLHLYREGYGDKWACPVPADAFPHIADAWQTLADFMRYCRITRPPHIRRGLWS